MQKYRIVSFNRETVDFQVIKYFDDAKDADKELRRMAKAGECKKELLYYIQEYVPVPVKSPYYRAKFLEEIKNMQNSSPKDIRKMLEENIVRK